MFHTKTGVFATLLECSMTEDITSCTKFHEDSAFGILHNEFSLQHKGFHDIFFKIASRDLSTLVANG
jgi:hypothetical protein